MGAELTKHGETLFREAYYGTFFKSSMVAVKDAEMEFNRMYAIGEGDGSLALFYRLLDLSPPEGSKIIGWDPDYMMDEWETYWIYFQHYPKFTDDGTPYCDIGYPIPPTSLFYERSFV